MADSGTKPEAELLAKLEAFFKENDGKSIELKVTGVRIHLDPDAKDARKWDDFDTFGPFSLIGPLQPDK